MVTCATARNGRGMNRRKLLKRTTGVLAASALAGCSGSNDGNGSSNGDGSDGGSSDGGDGGPKTTKDSSPETFKNEAGVPVGANFEAVKQLAKEEDAAPGYITQDREAFQAWFKAFHEEYPDVTIEGVTGGNEDMTSKFSTEYETDNVSGNFYTGGASSIAPLVNRGQTMELTAEYMPSFGKMSDNYKSSDGQWVTTDLLTGLVLYNTDMVSASDAEGWMDIVTKDKFADQNLGWDPTPILDLMWWLEDHNGKEFFENLSQQSPRFVDSHTDLARFCGSGEFGACFTFGHKLARFTDLPLDFFRFPKAPAALNVAVLSAKAPQPNTSILFLDWLTSKAGQQVLGTTPYVPFHTEAKYEPYPEIMPPDGFEYEGVMPSDVDYEATEKMFNKTVNPTG